MHKVAWRVNFLALEDNLAATSKACVPSSTYDFTNWLNVLTEHVKGLVT